MTSAQEPKALRLLPNQIAAAEHFYACFQASPAFIATAPGRINFLGEHTDYNQGFVLPAAIDRTLSLAIAPRTDDGIRYFSADFNERWTGSIASIPPALRQWPDYINGVVASFRNAGLPLAGFDLAFGSDLPMGAGMASSAALEVATALALTAAFGKPLDKLDLVRYAQLAENKYLGVKSGITDPFACIFGKAGNAVFLDCRSLKYEYLPVDLTAFALLLIGTGSTQTLTEEAYNLRREQCEAGVKALRKVYPQVKSLRDANRAMIEYSLKDRVPDLIYHRCKYVVEENLRLQVSADALRRQDLVGFGKKMFATHAGLSKLYEVSCRELDFLVELARHEHAIVGARMMGGGFGAATINIVRKNLLSDVMNRIGESYRQEFGSLPNFQTCQLADGADLSAVDQTNLGEMRYFGKL
ncbi:MAG TPA: galactokinase [Flavihumibacter sp.]|nr:galactokinase [Flavihumibacter sp.]